jgi:Rps23 Pro-64 3,4-dihydroxylase Tpa1-like proline 4-hydroxylase
MFETLVIDDFLDEKNREILKAALLYGAEWNFIHDMDGKEDIKYPSYGFVHVFKHPDEGVKSRFYKNLIDLFVPKINQKANIEVKDVYYVRSFLQIPLEAKFYKERNNVHVDIPQKHIAAVYYVTDSDGDTVIYDNTYGEDVKTLQRHKTVTPKAGRMVFFDGSRYHCSSQPTESARCIINFDLIV